MPIQTPAAANLKRPNTSNASLNVKKVKVSQEKPLKTKGGRPGPVAPIFEKAKTTTTGVSVPEPPHMMEPQPEEVHDMEISPLGWSDNDEGSE